MHDYKCVKMQTEQNLFARRQHCGCFPDGDGTSDKTSELKSKSLVIKSNTTNTPDDSSPTFAEFNRYSFPLSPCSPNSKSTKTFKEVINDTINTQRQEKRAVSLMPEILLHAAVLDNNVDEILKLLRVDRVDINRGAQMGLFSLHEAAFSGLEQVTEILVENGANVHLVTPEGLTPLDAAVRAGNFECAEILIKNGASIDSIKNGFVDRR